MAFIRKRFSSVRGYTWYSFQLIESYRDCGNVRQRVLHNIGAAWSAADAIRRYQDGLPDQYREEILRRLEHMALSETPVEEQGETVEELTQKIRRALGRA